jgi:hypothetical protein
MNDAALETHVREIVVDEVEGGTRLRLVHSGFVTPKNDSAYQGMSEGWKKVVAKVGTLCSEALVEGVES